MSAMYERLASAHTALERLEMALQQESETGKNKKGADFKEAYPVIEQHLAKKVPQKVVLAKFNSAYGHTVHPPRFRQMLLDERKRRAEAGEAVNCSECCQQLCTTDNMDAKLNEAEGQ